MRVKTWDRWLIVIGVVAAALRLFRPDLYQFVWDEVSITFSALMLARHGRWTWLSNHTSWAALPGHSPLSNYLDAVPYLFTSNPVGTRLFVGLLGVAAVVVVYLMTQRYFGQTAAIVAGLFAAVAPTAIDWSRWVWNPNFAQVFIALWMFLGLLGYYEGKRWAQTASWLALSCAVQIHIGNALLAPLALLLLVVGYFRPGADRRILVRYTLLGWLLTLLSLVPWGIGLFSAGFLQNAASNATASVFTGTFPPDLLNVFSYLVSSTEFAGILKSNSGPGNWWPPAAADALLWAKTGVTLVGVAWLIVAGLRSRWKRFPGLFVALVTLLPLLGYLVSPINVYGFYLLSIMFGAFPVQGIALAKVWQWGKSGRLLTVLGVGLVVALQCWLVVAELRWLDVDGTQEAFRAPMSVHQAILDSWMQHVPNIVVLTETQEGKSGATEQSELWAVVGEGYPLRIIPMPQGIPVSPGGQILASTYAGATIPTWFGSGQTAGRLSNGQPIFRWVQITPDALPKPNLLPAGSALFNNGARILGIYGGGKPAAGQTWPIVLLWRPQQSYVSEEYHFSVRLVDDQSHVYGQQDEYALGGELWRAGDTVLNQIDLHVGDQLPDRPLSVQVLMYTWPALHNASVVDQSGNSLAQWVVLPLSSWY